MQNKKVAFFSVMAMLFASVSSFAAVDGFGTYTAVSGETKVIDLGPEGEDQHITVTLINKSDKPVSVEIAEAFGLVLVGLEIDGLPMENGFYNSKDMTIYSAAQARSLGLLGDRLLGDDDIFLIEHDYHGATTNAILTRGEKSFKVSDNW